MGIYIVYSGVYKWIPFGAIPQTPYLQIPKKGFPPYDDLEVPQDISGSWTSGGRIMVPKMSRINGYIKIVGYWDTEMDPLIGSVHLCAHLRFTLCALPVMVSVYLPLNGSRIGWDHLQT